MEFRRLLSFHIISQIGYMIMGLGLYTPLALAGTVFYLIHHIVVKTNLFLLSGVVRHLQGSYRLASLGGLWRTRPGLGLLFLVPAFSLAGVPPLSGFWGKLVLVKAGLAAEQWEVTAVALGVSVLTLFSMTKIWNEVFWKPFPSDRQEEPVGAPAALLGPVAVLCLVTLAVGLGAGPVFRLAMAAAEQLADPGAYVTAVLAAEGGP
jgi:multicomponent Na+:H+ antiporter subunit D